MAGPVAARRGWAERAEPLGTGTAGPEVERPDGLGLTGWVKNDFTRESVVGSAEEVSWRRQQQITSKRLVEGVDIALSLRC